VTDAVSAAQPHPPPPPELQHLGTDAVAYSGGGFYPLFDPSSPLDTAQTVDNFDGTFSVFYYRWGGGGLMWVMAQGATRARVAEPLADANGRRAGRRDGAHPRVAVCGGGFAT
jgi:hypothetical protein